LLWAPLVAIGAAAFAVQIPFFFLGTPSGHDVEFHLYSWLEVLAQWKRGIIFPRWAALAHFGYGEPRFVFYPPASWTLGAGLSAIFPWTVAASIYIWIALVAAGVSMFVLARRWLDRRDAIFAALLYAVNPYHLVNVYWRSAFAELLASCLLPLLLLFVLKAVDGDKDKDKRWRAIVPLGLVLATAWLTNAPAAVMIHYSLALLIVFFAWQRRSARLLLVGVGAVALGAGLAAFYLLPAIYEQRWIDIAQAVSAGSRPADSFLFIHTTDADHDAFNRIVSWVAVLEMVVIFAASWAARQWRETKRDLWNVLLGWAIACSVLMFPVARLLWRILPKMEFMQFPWRWLLCLSLIFCVFVTVGLRRWWWRGAVCVLSILVIVSGWHRVQAPWWDNAADLREMQDNMVTGAGYEGTDEYAPAGADPTAINPAATNKNARNVTVDGPAHAAIHIYRWEAESRMFTAEMSAPDQLALRLFRYPAWQVEVNGRVVETAARPDTGQMLVPVEAGLNRVQIRFVRTWDRSAGGWISLIAAICLGLWTLMARRRTNRVQI
jgi:6-pyruvoyl-tetrahydropterin synthase related domain